MFRFGCVLLAVAASGLALVSAASASDMEWQFSESNEPENKGALTARLVYGVPETDNIQVTGVCDGRPSTGAKFSSLIFGADVGPDPKDGEPVDLRFTGGGFDHVAKGNIHRPQAEEGIVGVHLEIEHTDPLWQALQEKSELDYFVPGYRASTLDLTRGKDKIGAFITACRGYAEAILGTKDTEEEPPASGNGTPEKDAFAAAKELGTPDAWNAFLANYPTGFHADLARAYLKKLEQGAAPPPAQQPAAAPAPSPTQSATEVACGEQGRIRSKNSDTPARITFKNNSGAYRSILWLDFNGQPKSYANLDAGQEITLETFLTHPWMVTDGPGNCIAIALPRDGASLFDIGVAPAAPKKTKTVKKKPKLKTKLPAWQLEGLAHGCKKGLAWNAQEGCHEND